MPPSSRAKRQPTVFISYAHESDALRVSVKALADWLGSRDCRVLTDHLHADRPPPEGWQTWMQRCVEKAEMVLIVCTPRLKARYEKTEDIGFGRGAAYEGAIVTQLIYNDNMRNTKFFPILPDGGSLSDIPITLQPWWNDRWFPSGHEEIWRMVSGDDPGGHGQGGDSGEYSPAASFANAQQRLTIELLGAAGARPLLAALKPALVRQLGLNGHQIPGSAAEIVGLPIGRPTDEIESFLFAVHDALEDVQRSVPGQPGLQQNGEAAAALYMLAACQLVARAAEEQSSAAGQGYVLEVPTSERLICAVIATALFGGELHLRPSTDQPDLPGPEYGFTIKLDAGSDHIESDFERAVYFALFSREAATTAITLDSRPLTDKQRAKLEVEVTHITKRRKRSLALVVSGVKTAAPFQNFASRNKIPVMLPTTEATRVLLGMKADHLLFHIATLWKIVEASPSPGSAQPERSELAPYRGDPPMPAQPNSPQINVTGDGAKITFQHGNHSVAQDGAGSVAHIAHHQGSTDPSALVSALQALRQAIDEVPSPRARQKLAQDAEIAQVEAGKKDKGDPKVIKEALDRVRYGAEMLEEGGKILGLCKLAYNPVAPLLGLPPIP